MGTPKQKVKTNAELKKLKTTINRIIKIKKCCLVIIPGLIFTVDAFEFSYVDISTSFKFF